MLRSGRVTLNASSSTGGSTPMMLDKRSRHIHQSLSATVS